MTPDEKKPQPHPQQEYIITEALIFAIGEWQKGPYDIDRILALLRSRSHTSASHALPEPLPLCPQFGNIDCCPVTNTCPVCGKDLVKDTPQGLGIAKENHTRVHRRKP